MQTSQQCHHRARQGEARAGGPAVGTTAARALRSDGRLMHVLCFGASDDSRASGRPAPEDRAEDLILQVEAPELEPQTWGPKWGRDSPGGEGNPKFRICISSPSLRLCCRCGLLPGPGLITSGAGTRPFSSSPRQSPGSRSGDVTLRSDSSPTSPSFQLWVPRCG